MTSFKSLLTATLLSLAALSANAGLGKTGSALEDAKLQLCQQMETVIKGTARIANDTLLTGDLALSNPYATARDTLLSTYKTEMNCPMILGSYKAAWDELKMACDQIWSAYESKVAKLPKNSDGSVHQDSVIKSANLLLKALDDKDARGCKALNE